MEIGPNGDEWLMKSGNPVLQMSAELGGLSNPAGISVANDPVNETIYIADPSANRVIIATLPRPDPLSTWHSLKTNLSTGNTQAALSQFSQSSVDQCNAVLTALGSSAVSQKLAAIGQLTAISVDDDEARYYFFTTINGQLFSFVVTLVMENGIWKIRNF